jgi:organic radical activating enzyme
VTWTLRLVADNPIFDTLQGEGVLAGAPSTFLRLAGCDLRCARRDGVGWSCDTPHSLPDYDVKQGKMRVAPTRFAFDTSVDAVKAELSRRSPSKLVITGGEPTLQADALSVLLGLLEIRPLHVTLESNGRRCVPGLARLVDLISLSPKAYQPDTVDFPELSQWLLRAKKIQIKIVLADLQPHDFVVKLFEFCRNTRDDAMLIVQRAAVPASAPLGAANDVVEWVMNDRRLRELDVYYGVQMHKQLGVP